MGRKNRMKSTFINDVRPGTFWIRHNQYQQFEIFTDTGTFKNTILEKEDVVIVLGFLEGINYLKDAKMVRCYSQKMNRVYTTTLENFYFNYHKL